MQYEYITIPTCWLPKELLSKYVDKETIETISENKSLMLSYYVISNTFVRSNLFCKLPEQEYLCNTPEEFDEQVSKARLERLLRN